jgi:hypothetical protein
MPTVAANQLAGAPAEALVGQCGTAHVHSQCLIGTQCWAENVIQMHPNASGQVCSVDPVSGMLPCCASIGLRALESSQLTRDYMSTLP